SIAIKCPECKYSFTIPGGGDKDCLVYLVNRHAGAPKQHIDLEGKVEHILTPDKLMFYAMIVKELKEAERLEIGETIEGVIVKEEE
ncbi:hypothetical protein LCGC14_2856770, partial [marine sediment metagenome]